MKQRLKINQLTIDPFKECATRQDHIVNAHYWVQHFLEAASAFKVATVAETLENVPRKFSLHTSFQRIDCLQPIFEHIYLTPG